MAHGLCCSMAMWDLPGPGLKPVSPALAGGFLTTVPPGKSHKYFLKREFYEVKQWKEGLRYKFGQQLSGQRSFRVLSEPSSSPGHFC